MLDKVEYLGTREEAKTARRHAADERLMNILKDIYKSGDEKAD